MKSFVITLKNHNYSENVANRCIQSAKQFGIIVDKFYGIDKNNAFSMMKAYGLKWTWANNNTKKLICPVTGLHQFPYKSGSKLADLNSKIGCSMSHYLLWQKCIELDEPILILEHDAIFISNLVEIDFNGVCQVNDPLGATRKGKWWSDQIKIRGPGVFNKTVVPGDINIPDGLAGNSAYLIRPWAARKIINTISRIGLWPNDAIICRQLFPWLQEYYPFITMVKQKYSTSIN